jgi:hypothetical protein
MRPVNPGTSESLVQTTMRVGLLVLVQPDEIGTIKGQQRALPGDSKGQHVTVSDSLIGPTRLVGRQHVMTQSAKLLDDAVVEILVGMESSHGLQASSFSRIACSISSRFCR